MGAPSAITAFHALYVSAVLGLGVYVVLGAAHAAAVRRRATTACLLPRPAPECGGWLGLVANATVLCDLDGGAAAAVRWGGDGCPPPRVRAWLDGGAVIARPSAFTVGFGAAAGAVLIALALLCGGVNVYLTARAAARARVAAYAPV
jgi:hypothetical protein